MPSAPRTPGRARRPRTRREAARRTRARRPWARLSDEKLLELRFCDLKLSLERSPLARRVRRLYAELEHRGIHFRPHVWLSEEWFSPDGVPGIAVPFYLAHPRLERLERRIMREAEGGNARWLMRILRHEAGHALDNAYRLRRRKMLARCVRAGLTAVSRIGTGRGPAAAATCITWASGMRSPIPPRISRRPSRCG